MMGAVMPTSEELRAKALDMAHRARQLQVEVDQLNDKDRKTPDDWTGISVTNEKIRHALQLSSIYANVAVAAALDGQANKV